LSHRDFLADFPLVLADAGRHGEDLDPKFLGVFYLDPRFPPPRPTSGLNFLPDQTAGLTVN
jgi:hypothetical protein